MNHQTQLSPIIKGLRLGLAEVGKIKIGRKGQVKRSAKGVDFQMPEKLDHFIITTMERDATGNFVKDDAIHATLGDNPKEIPIILVYDDITLDFQCRYACFTGRKLWCAGDGEHAIREGNMVECPCDRAETDHDPDGRCKMNGILSVMIRDVNTFGGVWKYRTTGWNSIQAIYSSLTAVKQVTGGPLAGIPLKMVVTPKTATAPDGKSQIIYVVGILYDGSMTALRGEGLKVLKETAGYRHQMERLEQDARKELPAAFDGEDAADIVEEFYPEQAEGYIAPARPTIELDDGTQVDAFTGEVIEAEPAEPSAEDAQDVPDAEPPAPDVPPAAATKAAKSPAKTPMLF